MKNFCIFLLATFIVPSLAAQELRFQHQHISGVAYNSVSYAGGHTLYIVGDSGNILKSENDGESFFSLNTLTDKDLRSVDFINPDTGIIIGAENLILRTTDGGQNWQDHSTYWATGLYSVCYADADTVYAAGWREGCLPPGGTNPCGTIIKSNDGGITWYPVFSQTLYTLYSVYFNSPTSGHAVGDWSLYCGYNGSWWNTLYLEPTTYMTSVHFPDASTGFITGGDGSIWKSTDNGGTWDTIETGIPHDAFESVWFTDPSVGYLAGGSGTILETADGGISWSRANTGTNQWLLSITFMNRDTGFAVGMERTILRTTDAGITWNNIYTGTGMEKDPSAGLLVYPQPSPGTITIEFPSVYSYGDLTISTITGLEIIKQKVTGHLAQLDISNLAKGVYFIKLISGDKVHTGKLIRD